jgi:hypothetical protein
MYKLILTSICGTYREVLKCKSLEEAQALAAAAVESGEWNAKIIPA